MDPESWERAKDILFVAQELDEQALAAFVKRECSDSPELAALVQDLLSNRPPPPKRSSGSAPRIVRVGETLADRFLVSRYIGGGGMGQVFEAIDAELQERVAIKGIRPDIEVDEETISRFRNEVALARRVKHPGVCRIHDLVRHRQGSDGPGFLMLSMELLEGPTLEEYLRNRSKANEPLALDEAKELLVQICDALDCLHRAGIVHRDVKPSNIILVTNRGRKLTPVLTDFGISVLEEQSRAASDTGPVPELGTPYYMAPECYRAGEASTASDIYSLGLVLYEMATLERAFSAETPNFLWYQKTRYGPTPPRKHRKDLPRRWEAAILSALDPEPKNRFSSASELVDALEHPAARFTSSHRAVLAAVAAAVLVGLLGWAFPRTGGPVESDQIRQLAVLPFRCLGQAPHQQAFCDGMLEAVGAELIRLESGNLDLAIVPVSEVVAREVASPSEARQRLGATLAVDGSVQRLDDEYRVTLSVVDTTNLRPLGADSFQARADDALSLPRLATASVARMLKVKAASTHPPNDAVASVTDLGSDSLLLQARGYLLRYDRPGALEAAMEILDHINETSGPTVETMAGLGEASWRRYMSTKDGVWVDRAIEYARQALMLDESAPEAKLTLAQVYAGTARDPEAAALLRSVADLDPTNAQALEELARCYDRMGKPAEAERTFKRAIQLRPNHWDGYNRLAMFYRSRGRYSESVSISRQAAALTPDNAIAHNNLAVALYYAEDFEGARQEWERSAEIWPLDRTLSSLCSLYYEEDRLDTALSYCRQACDDEELDHHAWGQLADVLFAKDGLSDETIKAYQRAEALVNDYLEIRPNDPLLLAFLAWYSGRLGKSDAAAQYAGQAVELAPDNPSVLVHAAKGMEAAGRRAEAIDTLERALERGLSARVVGRVPEFRQLTSDARYRKISARVASVAE